MINQAVIVAGGEGTRLKNVTGDLPKPMVKIRGKSIIDRLIYKLKRNNINIIYISTNYLSDQFTEKYKENKNIKIIKDGKLTGNAGFFFEYRKLFKGNTLILYADLFFSTRLSSYIKFHYKNQYLNSIMLHKINHKKDSDLIIVKDNNIIDISFYKKAMRKLVSADKNKVIEQFVIHCYSYKDYVENRDVNFFLTHNFEDKCDDNNSLLEVIKIKDILRSFNQDQINIIFEYLILLSNFSTEYLKIKFRQSVSR